MNQLREALRKIAEMDLAGQRADDLGRAARIAHTALQLAPMTRPLTPDELADKCEEWLNSTAFLDNVVDAFEAGYRACEEAAC